MSDFSFFGKFSSSCDKKKLEKNWGSSLFSVNFTQNEIKKKITKLSKPQNWKSTTTTIIIIIFIYNFLIKKTLVVLHVTL
jgi:hypothetical protein